jgi:hypothetical protein
VARNIGGTKELGACWGRGKGRNHGLSGFRDGTDFWGAGWNSVVVVAFDLSMILGRGMVLLGWCAGAVETPGSGVCTVGVVCRGGNRRLGRASVQRRWLAGAGCDDRVGRLVAGGGLLAGIAHQLLSWFCVGGKEIEVRLGKVGKKWSWDLKNRTKCSNFEEKVRKKVCCLNSASPTTDQSARNRR